MEAAFVLFLASGCGNAPSGTGGTSDDSGATECNDTFYPDVDDDRHGNPLAPAIACVAPDGFTATSDDCDDTDPAVNPDADELCNGIDDDCDALTDSFDPDLVQGTVSYADADGDGYGDPATGAHACEVPPDRVLDSTDCDDTDALVHPVVDEVCDHVDNDCNGLIDAEDEGVIDLIPFFEDADGDGVGNDDVVVIECFSPSGYVSTGGDCDDADAGIGAALTYFLDGDGDGYGAGGGSVTCEPGADSVLVGGDCESTDPSRYPGAPETCDAGDDNCDGLVDDDDPLFVGTIWYADDDGDGYGDPTDTVASCDEVDGYVADATDCNDGDAELRPGAIEYCDGIDNDCNGTIDDSVVYSDWYADADGDGYGDADVVTNDCVQPSGYTAAADDCDDTDAATNPDAPELCGTGVDEDCNDVIDDCELWVDDADVMVKGTENSRFGRALAVADPDGDGSADLIVGAYYDGGAGAAYVLHGPVSASTTLLGAPRLGSSSPDAYFGSDVGGGDADGDGVDDVIVGATADANPAAYLFLGPVTGDRLSDDADLILEGAPDTNAGDAVAILPDFDGDAEPDVLVGAPYAGRARFRYAGDVYIVSGASSGTVDLVSDASIVFHGSARSDSLGYASVGLGDANGDGIDDVAVSAAEGAHVYVLAGGASAGTYDVAAAASADISVPSGSSNFGIAMAGADYDGDGTADLIVDETRDVAGTTGTVYGFLGPLSGSMGDTDAHVRWTTTDSDVENLGTSLAVGDMDGDKSVDVLMGAWGTTVAGAWDAGAAFLQLGPATGTVDVTTLLSIRSTGVQDYFGVAGVLFPDWTGDDGDEVIVGYHRWEGDDISGYRVGAVCVWLSDALHP